MRKAVALLTGDWHFSHRAPACRAEQLTAEWYGVMANYLGQIRDLSNCLEVPTLCAGDLFDRPDNPAELVNFAIKQLGQFRKKIYAVPGNHDLIHNRLDDLKRTSYWTLVEADVIVNLNPKDLFHEGATRYDRLWLSAFPEGVEPRPLEAKSLTTMMPYIAVCHKYIWDGSAYHPGVTTDSAILMNRDKFKDYDFVALGDNHKGWLRQPCGRYPGFWNGGTLIRRKSDEINHKPAVGILYKHGPEFKMSVEPHYLDVSNDRFIDAPEGVEAVGLDDEELLKELRSLGSSAIDFGQTLLRVMDRKSVRREVRDLVNKLLEEEK